MTMKLRLLSSCLVLFAALSATGASDRKAIRWAQPVTLATNSSYNVVDDPSVALWANGDAAIVWVDQARKDVLWQIVAPDGSHRLARPLDVSRTPTAFSWLPRIGLSPRDPLHVYVLWQEIVFSGGPHGGEIVFARSVDGGHSFEPPQHLTQSIAGHNGSIDIAVGEDGVIYTAWTDYEGTLTFRRSRDAGKTFDPAVVVAPGGNVPTRAPSLAVASGTIYLAWTVGETDNADIRVASSRDGKTFSAPVLVRHSHGYCDAPKLAVDPSGTLHLAYAEAVDGPFGAAEVRYTQSRDGNTFERPRVISQSVALGGGAAFPSLAVDGKRVFVTWEHTEPGDKQPHGIAMAYSLDSGGHFTLPNLVEGTRDRGPNGGFEGRLTRKLAVTDDTIAVVNSAMRPGESSRVWLVRGHLAGAARQHAR